MIAKNCKVFSVQDTIYLKHSNSIVTVWRLYGNSIVENVRKKAKTTLTSGSIAFKNQSIYFILSICPVFSSLP